MNLKKKKILTRAVRAAIQAGFFIAFPSIFTTAFSGVKYVFSQIHSGAPVELTSFIIVLGAVAAFTCVFGRFFCGYVCAFGALSDAVYGISQGAQKLLHRKLPKIPLSATRYLCWIKYIVLGLIIVLCLTGLYTETQGSSAWDVFSLILAGNFHLRAYTVGCILLAVILVGMAFKERFFCLYLCPMGAIFSLLPMIPWCNMDRDRQVCPGKCGACKKACPAALDIDGDTPTSGECIQCGKCVQICPKKNIRSGIVRNWKDEIGWAVVEAALFVSLCFWIGV